MLGRSALLAATNSTPTGFGAKFANPTTAVPGEAQDIKFSPSGLFVAVAHERSPYISAYNWSDFSGFGDKVANPTFIPSGSSAFGYGVRFSPAEDAVAYGYRRDPRLIVLRWSSVGFGSNYAPPSTLPSGDGRDVEFSPQGDAIAVVCSTTALSSIRLSAYRWSSATGIGAEYTNPVGYIQTAAGSFGGVAFSPSGGAIVACHGNHVNAYPWSHSSGFGARYTDPSIAPAGEIYRVRFSPDGNSIGFAHDNSPFVSIYPWSDATGFGVKYANPAILPAAGPADMAFSPSGDAIVLTQNSTPFVAAYRWTASGFGSKYANPAILPTAGSTGIAFSPSGEAVAICNSFSSPYITAYQWNS